MPTLDLDTDACWMGGVDDLPSHVRAAQADIQFFDPTAQSYGHGNNKTGKETKSILHPDLKTIPHQPEVQLIGHGQVPGEYEGLDQVSYPGVVGSGRWERSPMWSERCEAARPSRWADGWLRMCDL